RHLQDRLERVGLGLWFGRVEVGRGRIPEGWCGSQQQAEGAKLHCDAAFPLEGVVGLSTSRSKKPLRPKLKNACTCEPLIMLEASLLNEPTNIWIFGIKRTYVPARM